MTARKQLRSSRARNRRRTGITLIEMLVVVTIIALFAAVVGVQMMKKADQARVTAAKVQINNLMDALNAYKASIKVQDYRYAISQYAQAALRDVVGGMSFDDLLAERQLIGEEIEKIVKKESSHIRPPTEGWLAHALVRFML